jgi:hypothetical protein
VSGARPLERFWLPQRAPRFAGERAPLSATMHARTVQPTPGAYPLISSSSPGESRSSTWQNTAVRLPTTEPQLQHLGAPPSPTRTARERNDNPFSEAPFRAFSYSPDCPGKPPQVAITCRSPATKTDPRRTITRVPKTALPLERLACITRIPHLARTAPRSNARFLCVENNRVAGGL